MDNKDNFYKEVLDFARKKHDGQFRFDGITPYFNHVERVANSLKKYEPALFFVAALHDVIEDGRATEKEVNDFAEYIYQKYRFYSFNVSEIREALQQLNHNKSVDYFEYIRAINDRYGYARIVKIADILDNLSDSPSPNQVKKYAKALKILLGVE